MAADGSNGWFDSTPQEGPPLAASSPTVELSNRLVSFNGGTNWQSAPTDCLAFASPHAYAHGERWQANDNYADLTFSTAFEFSLCDVSAPDGPESTIADSQAGIPPRPTAVAWIEPAADAATDRDLDGSGPDAACVFGRVMLKRFDLISSSDGSALGIRADGSNVIRITANASSTGESGALASANDNTVWVGDEDASGTGGAIGRDAQAAGLVRGDTIVTWVGRDGVLNGKAYPPSAAIPAGEVLSDLESTAAVASSTHLTSLLQNLATLAPDQRYRLVETAGRDGIAILWAASISGAIVMHGRLIETTDDPDEPWTARELPPNPLKPSFKITTDFQVLGWSDDHGHAIVSYTTDVGTEETQSIAAVAGDDEFSVADARDETAPCPHSGGALGDRGDGTSNASSATASDAAAQLDDETDAAERSGPQQTRFSLHAGIIDDANLIVGDRAAANVLVGTQADDVIVGGDKHDEISGGLGDNVLIGGGGDDLLDGDGNSAAGVGIDTAVFAGHADDYSITVNGDGSYTVILARVDAGASVDRDAEGFEGVDQAIGIEQYQFLEGDTGYVDAISSGSDISELDTTHHTLLRSTDLYALPTERNTSTRFDGTPTAWGLSRNSDGEVDGTFDVRSSEAELIGGPVLAATANGGFVVGWAENGSINVATFDALGRPDPRNGPSPLSFGDGTLAVDTPIAIDGAGNGMAVAYVSSTDGGGAESTIEVRVVGGTSLAPAGSVSGSIAGDGSIADIAISGCDASGSPVTVAWVETSGAADGSDGTVKVQRLAIEAAADVDGVPRLTEAGLDGQAGEGDDGAVVLGTGRAPAITETSDEGLAIAWVSTEATADATGDTGHIEGQIFNSVGVAVENFVLPVGTGRHIREGTGPTIETTANGELVVSWQEEADDASGLAIMTALLQQLGPEKWSEPIVRELRKFENEPSEVSIAVAGENGDAIILTWSNDGSGGGEIVGQRYSVEAIGDGAADIAVGLEFQIASGSDNSGSSGSSKDKTSVTGLDDGRVVVVMRETSASGSDDGVQAPAAAPAVAVKATILDTRNPDDVIIGADSGAASELHVGTTGDDIVDGRASQDELFGALGADVLTGGTGDDNLDGGEDDDTLLGGSGSDRLIGGGGDDLLMGGFGRDYISGGDGIDTLSYRGETRAVVVDLATGTVRSDSNHNAVARPLVGLDVRGVSSATFYDTGVEDLIGRIENTNSGSNGGIEFTASNDIENIEGGLGSDTLRGDSQDNVVTGGKGDDEIDGRDGVDTARYTGRSADYDLTVGDDGGISVSHVRNTTANGNDGTDLLRNIERIEFADGLFDLMADGSLSPQGIAAALGIVSEISVAAVECFDFVDLDQLDEETEASSGSASVGSPTEYASDLEGEDVTPELYGLGSDTLDFRNLDLIFGDTYDKAGAAGANELFGGDELDYSACTIFAEQAALDAALCLDAPDSIDTTGYLAAYETPKLECDLFGDRIA